MKRVFLISVLALACFAGWTGCSNDDDGGATMTGIKATPNPIKLPVGSEQKVTVTAEPQGATGTYKFTSQNTSIATVDDNGIVKIVGVGTTTITVESGDFKAIIDVEGTINSIAIKDDKGESAGTYPYNGQTIAINLKLVVVPANASIAPVWSSIAENDNVILEVAENGLTAKVTITGIGSATVTVTEGDATGTYAISTESAFESAAGYWTFDDETNLGKATKGTDLTELAAVESVAGPSATKKAVQVKDQQKALKWEHNLTIADYEYNRYGVPYKIANTFTVLFDVQPTEDMYNIDRIAAPLYWNEYLLDMEYAPKAENWAFAVRSMDNFLKLYANGNSWSFEEFTDEIKATKPWYRIVIKVWPAVEGEPGYEYDPDGENADPNGSFHRELWVNGVKIEDQVRNGNTFFRVGFFENMPTWFLTGSEENRAYFDDGKQRYYDNIHIPCSTIAVWNKLLKDDEIASLGGVSK
jgi:hypothetical protein